MEYNNVVTAGVGEKLLLKTYSWLQTLTNSHATSPNGLYIDYSGASPDGIYNYFIRCDDSTTTRMRVSSNGDVWTSDSGILTSDETLKENIVPATSKLAEVLALEIINFNWTDELHKRGSETQTKKRLGYGASQVEGIFPGLISLQPIHDAVLSKNGDVKTPAVMKKCLRSGVIGSPILVKAFQEYVARTDAAIAALEAKVELLEAP